METFGQIATGIEENKEDWELETAGVGAIPGQHRDKSI